MKVHLEQHKTGPLWRRRTVLAPSVIEFDPHGADDALLEALDAAHIEAAAKIMHPYSPNPRELAKTRFGSFSFADHDEQDLLARDEAYGRTYHNFFLGETEVPRPDAPLVYEGIMRGIGLLSTERTFNEAAGLSVEADKQAGIDVMLSRIEYVYPAAK